MFFDPGRKEDVVVNTKTRLDLWEGHLKDPMAALTKALECLEKSPLVLAFGFVVCCCQSWWLQWLQYCGRGDFAKDLGKALLGRRLTLPGSMGRCACAHIIQLLECPGDVPATQGAFLSSLIKKESVALTKAVPFKPVVRRRSMHVR